MAPPSIPENPENPTLVYFPIRGRIEPARLMLEEAGVKYDVLVVGNEWEATKKEFLQKGYSAQGCVPMYVDKEIGVLSQTKAINFYVAQKYGFFSTDPIHASRILEILESIDDVYVPIVSEFFDPEMIKTVDQRKKHFRELLKNLESYLFPNGVKEYVYGDSLTIADFILYYVINSIRPYIRDVFDDLKILTAFRDQFNQRERIAAYNKSGRRPTKFTILPFSFGSKEEQCEQD